MERSGMYMLLVFFCLEVIGTLARRGGGGGGFSGWKPNRHDSDGSGSSEEYEEDDCDDDDDDDKKPRHAKWVWHEGAGLGMLLTMIALICGLLGMMLWLCCKIYKKHQASKVGMCTKSLPPDWSLQLVYRPELSVGFGLVSDGMARIGPAHLLRRRQGTKIADGATWGVGMTSGKHVFEITWPRADRGTNASVGVGTPEAPIKGKGSQPLVGSNDHSWGLDMGERMVLHSKKPVALCPNNGSMVPDKFQMYVDVDEGILGFGNDVTYWGDVITTLPKQGKKPLHVMIGTSRWQTEVAVQYKGSAPDDYTEAVKDGPPPHHLPPLCEPPKYTEVEERKQPLFVQPAAFCSDCTDTTATDNNAGKGAERPCSPPPPYVSPPPAPGGSRSGNPSNV